LGVLKITFVEAESATVQKLLNCNESELTALSKDQFTVAQGVVRFAANEFNQIQTQKKQPQAVKFDRTCTIHLLYGYLVDDYC